MGLNKLFILFSFESNTKPPKGLLTIIQGFNLSGNVAKCAFLKFDMATVQKEPLFISFNLFGSLPRLSLSISAELLNTSSPYFVYIHFS